MLDGSRLIFISSQLNKFYRILKEELFFKLNAWTIISLLVGLFIFLPMAEVLWHFTDTADSWEHLKETVLGRYLKGSFILVLGTACLSIITGVSCAWLVSCCDFPGRRFFEWALILPLAIPTYIAAYAYFDLLDMLNPLLVWIRTSFSINTMIYLNDVLVYVVTILVLASVLYPYIYLLARSSFSNQGSQLIEAAQMLGHSPKSIFWRVALPMARPAIVAGTSLVIMETLNDYGAVKHFGVPTFTTGIFRSWLGMDDISGALRLAACLMLFIFLLLLIEKGLRGGAKFNIGISSSQPFKRYSLHLIKSRLAILICSIPLLVGFIAPVMRLSFWATSNIEKLFNASFLKLIINSLSLATISSFVAVTVAIFLAYVARYFSSSSVYTSNRMAILGYSVPGAVVAIGILLFSGQINQLNGWVLTGSFFMLIFAYLIRFLAVAWQPIDSGMEKNCEQFNNASRSLGSSTFKSLIRVNIPLLKNTLLVAGLLVFIDTIKELPLTLILRPFNFETLATRTFDLTTQGQIPESSIPALCIILVVVFPAIWLNRQMEYKK